MKTEDEAHLKWLFLDLNSYFASVEQQERPELRGRPVIVAPMLADSTCAIAASYEAKAFGIRTGTKVGEARRLCPGLAVVPARHDIYVSYHHRILAEMDNHLPVTRVCSIDEAACELMGAERKTGNALALAARMQQGILKNVGECMRSSVGLAPSMLLAKTASDMKKPGGLTVLGAHQLPGPLLGLRLNDISGIGRRMGKRLAAAGVETIADFWALSPSRARGLWGSVMGEQVWYGLRGVDPPEAKTKRSSLSHSHVIAPKLRDPASAHQIARRMIARAASRLRRADLCCGRVSVFVDMLDARGREAGADFPLTADTFRLLDAFETAWARLMEEGVHFRPVMVGVNLGGLVPAADLTPDLLGHTGREDENPRQLQLSRAIDALNQRFGRSTVDIGATPTGLPQFMGAMIAFNRVPKRADFRD